MILKEVIERTVSNLSPVLLIKPVYLEFRLAKCKNCERIFKESCKYSKKQKFEKSFHVSKQKLSHISFVEIFSGLAVGNFFQQLGKTIFKEQIAMD